MIMTKLERITFTVSEDMADKVRAAVESGAYATASEVVREALRDWSEEREKQDAENALMREILAHARASGRKTEEEVEASVRAAIDAVEREQAKAPA